MSWMFCYYQPVFMRFCSIISPCLLCLSLIWYSNYIIPSLLLLFRRSSLLSRGLFLCEFPHPMLYVQSKYLVERVTHYLPTSALDLVDILSLCLLVDGEFETQWLRVSWPGVVSSILVPGGALPFLCPRWGPHSLLRLFHAECSLSVSIFVKFSTQYCLLPVVYFTTCLLCKLVVITLFTFPLTRIDHTNKPHRIKSSTVIKITILIIKNLQSSSKSASASSKSTSISF